MRTEQEIRDRIVCLSEDVFTLKQEEEGEMVWNKNEIDSTESQITALKWVLGE